jgi:hypothetical protein
MCRNLSPQFGPSCLTRTGGMPTATRCPEGPLQLLPMIFKKVDLFKLAGSKLDPRQELEAASQIWSRCSIAFLIGSLKEAYTEAETRRLIGTSPDDAGKPVEQLVCRVNPDETTACVKNLRNEWDKAGRSGPDAFAVFFAPKVLAENSGAPSCVDPGPGYDIVYLGQTQGPVGWTLAHELGHLLLGKELPHYVFESPLMHPKEGGNEIVARECRAARGDGDALSALRNRVQY